MSKKGGAATLQKDAPWRTASGSAKPVPKIHLSPVLRVSQNPYTSYACSVMKHHNPIGSGMATEAVVEAAGPDCIIPGLATPVKVLGLKPPIVPGVAVLENCVKSTIETLSVFAFVVVDKIADVWPIEVDLKFLEPVGRELQLLGKFMDNAVDLMNKSFIDR